MPATGLNTSTTTSPTTSARVDTTSKYSSARNPTRPSSFMFSMRAMPVTTVRKITGASSILINLMNASPRGLSAVPVSGMKTPTIAPQITAMSTCT
ncbi:hypothetical protein D3C84_196160 [compost metagenome]